MSNLAPSSWGPDVHCGARVPSVPTLVAATHQYVYLMEYSMAAKFEIFEDAKGEFRFRLKAGNGEIIATGEGYKTKSGVINGVDAVKRAAAEAEVDDKTGA